MPYAPPPRSRSTANQPRVLPNPGSVALLGTVLEMTVRERDGRRVRHEWDRDEAPSLLWSPSLKALMFFPGRDWERQAKWHEIQAPDAGILRQNRLDMEEARREFAKRGITLPKDATEAAKLFTQWAARPSTRVTQDEIPPYRLKPNGNAFEIVYRSDKWNGRKGKRVDYSHHFSKSGTVKTSIAPGKPPKAFFVKGGRLTVNDRGIIY